MRPMLLAVLALTLPSLASAWGAPKLVWEIREGLAQPESAHYEPETKTIFISNVAGEPGGKDGVGWITSVSPEGKVLEPKWLSGFNAPKGIRSRGGRLFIADIDEVIEVDARTGKILRKVVVEGAKFLNDVAIDGSGTVLVSDTMGGRVWRIPPGAGISLAAGATAQSLAAPEEARVAVLAEGEALQSPNGLFVDGTRLVVAGWGAGMSPDWSTRAPGRLYAIDLLAPAQPVKALTEPLGNLDGLEPDGRGWFVSDWVAGKVYRVSAGGKPEEILSGLGGAADLGWIPKKKLLLVPRMKDNAVSAYKL